MYGLYGLNMNILIFRTPIRFQPPIKTDLLGSINAYESYHQLLITGLVMRSVLSQSFSRLLSLIFYIYYPIKGVYNYWCLKRTFSS